jgi:hypothetical protein
LTNVDLARLLAPAAGDPVPRAELLDLTYTLIADPAFIWPVPAGGRPSGAGGAT